MAMQRKRRRRSGGNNNNNPNPNRHYESNGPDVRIRGSAQQILDKYLQYARDAQTSGDRVKAEALFQHAEHYARIVAVFEKQKEEARLEREAREAARAEERAQRDAERAARGETDGDADVISEDGEAPADTAEASGADGESEPKPRRRNRKPKADELAVVDADESDEAAPVAEASEAASEDKPKRRRTYSRKKEASADESDGVMKTLARGADEIVAEAE